MADYLRNHALVNLWCEPIQDYQYTFSPARITAGSGVLRYARVLGEAIPLPDFDTPGVPALFHVYQIGQLPPEIFKFELDYETWVDFATLSISTEMVAEGVVQNGCKLAPSDIYIRRNRDKNLIVAVKMRAGYNLGTESYYDESIGGVNTRPVSLNNVALTIRFYSNARVDTLEWERLSPLPTSAIAILSRYIGSEADFVDFTYEKSVIITRYNGQGAGVFYTDGYVCSDPIGWSTVWQGKTLTMVYDATIKRIVRTPLSSLLVFTSILDHTVQKRAVVLPPPYTMIDFHDDADLFLVKPGTGSEFKGVYFPRKTVSSVRQLTHTAYSVHDTQIQTLIDAHSDLLTGDVEIMVVVREGGMVRGLYPQASRVDELYKLSLSQIKEAMSLTNTQVPEWQAAQLEASDYNRLMRSSVANITRGLTEGAYGYNAAVKAVADPLCQTYMDGPRVFINIPNILNIPDKATGMGVRSFYYYQEGKLVGYSQDSGLVDEVQLPALYSDADLVECFNAVISGTDDGVVFDSDVSSKELAQYGFRCYACPIVGGVPSEIWEDVTDTAFYTYAPEGDAGNGYLPKIDWNNYLLSFANMYPAVKILKTHYVHTATANTLSTDGVIDIVLEGDTVWMGGPVTRPLSIPAGAVDVYLDGFLLIPNVDYYLRWPRVVIYRRSAGLGDDSDIVIRAYGPANPQTCQPYEPRDVGYIKQGIASVNARYDIRNDRAFRVSVAGEIKDRDVVRFSEAPGGLLQTDGRPYMVSDYLIPVENFTDKTLVPYREDSLDLDTRVMTYLNTWLPEVPPLHPHIVTERWEAFSPFCSAIIHAVLSGAISATLFDTPYTDGDIEGWVTPYKDLLDFDPCVQGFDFAYQVVYPHPYSDVVTLTSKQYAFVEAVIRLYLNQQTDLSYFVDIGG
jgi:hypothetical protein